MQHVGILLELLNGTPLEKGFFAILKLIFSDSPSWILALATMLASSQWGGESKYVSVLFMLHISQLS